MSVIAVSNKEHRFLVGGDWKTAEEKLVVRNPYSGDVAGITYWASEADAEAAVQSSVRGAELMASLPGYKRSDLLESIASRIRERKEEFAHTMTLESAKPISDSRAEVERAIMTFTIAAEEAKRLNGETLPLDLNQTSEGRMAIIRPFPVGVVLGITPFNFPLNLVAHKVAPALAAGNSIIVKPSPRTPLTTLLLAQVVQQSGAPSGSMNVVNLSNELTRKLIKDDRPKAFSFTGGTDVGWELKSLAGKKKVILELGGNAASIVDAGANIEDAIKRNVAGAFYYSGQSCISVQRVFIHRSSYDEFVEGVVEQTRSLVTGDPMDEGVSVGPLIDQASSERIEQWVNNATDRGAEVLIGGQRNGAFYQPTVLANVDPEATLSTQEAFGPVVLVAPFDEFGDAVARVNQSRYGLQVGLFTNNLEHAFQAFREFEMGAVIVNDAPTFRIDHTPYGGVKDSGYGREGVRYAMEELTETRMMVVSISK